MKKTIIITGAGSGLGNSLLHHFKNNNWQIIATVLNQEEKNDLATLEDVFPYVVNLLDVDSINQFITEITAQFDRIDAVINNAGMGLRIPVEEATDQSIQNIINVNYLGTIRICRGLIPIFTKQKEGCIMNITSIAGLVNLPLGSYYHSTKRAVESFSECLHYELLPFNIRVRTVQFGVLNTNFSENAKKNDLLRSSKYLKVIEKVETILSKKKKNINLFPKVLVGIEKAINDKSPSFKRYSIGFDAKLMGSLRRILGYRLFNKVVKFRLGL